MYYFYILYSEKLNRYYLGHTENLAKRLEQHNTGVSAYTSKAQDWVLEYKEVFTSREAARKREFEVKKKKSRTYVEQLIKAQG